MTDRHPGSAGQARTGQRPLGHIPAGGVYIGGLDRSGKTTMRAFLSSHSRIGIPAVGSNMWTYFYGRFGDLSKPKNLDRCLDGLMHYKHVRFLDPDPARIREEFAVGPSTYARLFALFLVHHAERAGKARWGAQTGLIERYADELFEAYPGLKIVHMLRDPRDRYEASLALWPDGRGRAGGATARWVYSTRLAERHTGRHPDGYMIVRFEDMVRSPEVTIRAVCRFLGEEFEPEMLEMPAAESHRFRLMKDGTPGPILSSDYIGRHRGVVNPSELAFIETYAGRLMRRHGYEPDTTIPGGRPGVTQWADQFLRMAAWRTVELAQQTLPRIIGRRPGQRMILRAPEAGS